MLLITILATILIAILIHLIIVKKDQICIFFIIHIIKPFIGPKFFCFKIMAKNMESPEYNIFGLIAIHFMKIANEDTSINAARKLKINSNDVVLELGPGNGYSLLEIKKFNPKRLIGIEISKRFFDDILKLNIDKLELYSQDAIDMSYLKNNSIDKILAINVVYFLNPLSDYCKEIYRIMKTNGIGLIVLKPKSIILANNEIFINKDVDVIMDIFHKAGFNVEKEHIDIGGDVYSNYIALKIFKNGNL